MHDKVVFFLVCTYDGIALSLPLDFYLLITFADTDILPYTGCL